MGNRPDDVYSMHDWLKQQPPECECGALITYKNEPNVEELHYTWCKAFKPKREIAPQLPEGSK